MLNILLIEDDESDTFLTIQALKKCTVQTEIVVLNDSKSVFSFLKNEISSSSFSRPDIILLSFSLPRKDGMSILRRLKKDKKLADIPVVILSTSSSEQLIRKCYAEYASGYICKPFDFDMYVRRIDCFAQYWDQSVILAN